MQGLRGEIAQEGHFPDVNQISQTNNNTPSNSPPAAQNGYVFKLTYPFLEELYSPVYGIDFEQPLSAVDPHSRLHSGATHSSLITPLLHLYDLFLHTTNRALSPPIPQFTFPPETITEIEANGGQFAKPFAFPKALIPTPEVSDSDANFPPTFNINDQQYIEQFLAMIGDPNAFADHLRSTVLLHAASKSIRTFLSAQFHFNNIDVRRLTHAMSTILNRILIHFHIICEHYDVVGVGSLNFASLLDLFFPSEVLLFYLPDRIRERNTSNDDEIAFITSTFPTALTKSPMAPTGTPLSSGLVFPTTFSSDAQRQAFSQHYTQLLPPTGKKGTKVPTSSIPCSVFVYLAFLNTIMVDLWWAVTNITAGSHQLTVEAWNHGLAGLVPLYLSSVPSLPTNLFDQILWTLANLFGDGIGGVASVMDQVDILQILNFKLHQLVRFPVLIEAPLASLKVRGAIPTLWHVVSIVSNIIRCKRVDDLLFEKCAVFGLLVVRILLLMLWAQNFTINTSPVLTSHIQENPDAAPFQSTFLTDYNELYLPNRFNSTPFQSASPQHPTGYTNTFTSTLLADPDQPKQPVRYLSQHAETTATYLEDCFWFIRFMSTSDACEVPAIKQSLASLFSPDLFQIALSLIIREKLSPVPITRALGNFVIMSDEACCNITLISNFYLLAEYISTVPPSEFLPSASSDLLKEIAWTMSNINAGHPEQIVHQLTGTTFFPFLNQTLASTFYSKYEQNKSYDLEVQEKIAFLRQQMLEEHSPSQTSPYLRIAARLVTEYGSAQYRQLLVTTPGQYPRDLPFLPQYLRTRDPPSKVTRDAYQIRPPPLQRVDIPADQFLKEQSFTMSNIFDFLGPAILSKNLWFINSTNTFSSRIQKEQGIAAHLQAPLIDVIAHPDTVLGVDPLINIIPYMAIHHNFSRTIFHFVSTFDWLSTASQPLQSLSHQFFNWILLYLELFHTFLCKQIQIETFKPVASPSPFSIANSACDVLTFGQPVSTETVDERLVYCCPPRTDSIHNPLFVGLHNLSTLPHYNSTLHKHAHLDPTVVKQLYYVYSEALLSVVMGFSNALFETPLMNDPTIKYSKTFQDNPIDFSRGNYGILSLFHDDERGEKSPASLLSNTGTIFKASTPFHEDSTLKSRTDALNDSYEQHLDQLYFNTDDLLRGLHQPADLKQKPVEQIIPSPPTTAQSSNVTTSTSERRKKLKPTSSAPASASARIITPTPKTRLDHSLPDHLIEQQVTGKIAIASEWSSAMVQHAIELFIDLLLHENSWPIVSEIDFSNDKQPLAKEYVIDYIPTDPTLRLDKTKWTTNQPGFSPNDNFPLYQNYKPTKYQPQIPTLAQLAICPELNRFPELTHNLPQSIYNPNNTTEDEKQAMLNYYNAHPTYTPYLIFDSSFPLELSNAMGYKCPTRGHLPFFYNLTTNEQDALYETFQFSPAMTQYPISFLPTSSTAHTATTISTAPVCPPHDLDLATYLAFINNDKYASNEPSLFTNQSNFLVSQYYPESIPDEGELDALFETLVTTSAESVLTATQHDRATRTDRSTFEPYLTLPLQPKSIIEETFHSPSIEADYITPNTAHLLAPHPHNSFPATYTVPTPILLAQIKFYKNLNQFAIKKKSSPRKFFAFPPASNASAFVCSTATHPLSHNILDQSVNMIGRNSTQVITTQLSILARLKKSELDRLQELLAPFQGWNSTTQDGEQNTTMSDHTSSSTPPMTLPPREKRAEFVNCLRALLIFDDLEKKYNKLAETPVLDDDEEEDDNRDDAFA